MHIYCEACVYTADFLKLYLLLFAAFLMNTLQNMHTQLNNRPVRLVPVKLCGLSEINDQPYTQTDKQTCHKTLRKQV